MSVAAPILSDLRKEITFTTSRSGGPGGQNVNKVNSKVTLRFDIRQSAALSEDQKNELLRKLSTRLTKEGVLLIQSNKHRSQFRNREAVIERFHQIITKAFQKRKKRKPTKRTKAANQKRIDEKKRRGEKKKWRREK